MELLRAVLFLLECLEGIDAQTVEGYVIHDLESDDQIEIPYPRSTGGCIQTGRSFHHGRFVMALRKAAQNERGVMIIEGTATTLLKDSETVVGIRYRDRMSREMREVFAPLTIICDGCFSRFRKGLVQSKVVTSSHFVGSIVLDCPQSLGNHAELVLGSCSPSLIYKISANETRVLVDVRGKIPTDLKGYVENKVAPHFPDHLRGPFLDALRLRQLRSMPSSFLPPAPYEIPGVIILGDAFNMRHPLTGGGMSVALNDVVLWRDLLKAIPDLSDRKGVMTALKKFQWQRKSHHSFVVNVLAQALYELFAASDDDMHSLQQACFAYFRLGGRAVSGPVGLLSVLSPNPLVLIGHFFAVAFYTMYFAVKCEKWWSVHRSMFKGWSIFWKACCLLFPLLWSERFSVIATN